MTLQILLNIWVNYIYKYILYVRFDKNKTFYALEMSYIIIIYSHVYTFYIFILIIVKITLLY